MRTQQRWTTLICAVLLLAASAALAHGIPGLKPLQPGQALTIGSFHGLARGEDGHYQRAKVDLQAAHDGSALMFLVFDPETPNQLTEAKRFEALLAQLPHTHGFLVLQPGRSMLVDHMAEVMDKTSLKLVTILDDRDVFPFCFRHDLKAAPRYEVFDRSQTLVIENAVHLGDRLEGGEPLVTLMKRLDRGEVVAPIVVSADDQAQSSFKE